MPDTGQETPSRLALVRARLNDLLSSFHASSGVSSDAYWAAPIFHPMAAGKCISSLVELHHAGLLSAAAVEQQVTPMIRSLAGAAVAPPPGVAGRCWGLGFGMRELPPDEPYLITSAIVTQALASLSDVLPGNDLCAELRQEGSTALGDWCQQWRVALDANSATSLPAYSRGIKRPVFNAAAMALSTLVDFVPEHKGSAREGLSVIWGHRIPGLGWRYDPGNAVIDLVHQAYLYGSMQCVIAVEAVAEDAASSIGQFAASAEWVDGLHLIDDRALPSQRRRLWIRLHPPLRIEVDGRRARLWSLGELLVLVSRIAAHPTTPGPWLERATAIADMVVSRLAALEGEAKFARHTMHAAHGLATYLRLKRSLG